MTQRAAIPGEAGADALRAALAEPAIALARKLAGLELRPVAGRPDSAWPRVVFRDAGTLGARLVFAIEAPLQRLLLIGLYASLGLTFEPGEEDAALGELGNCLMGHIDGRLARLGLEVEFSPPRIERDPPALPGGPTAAVVLEDAAGSIGIELYLHTKPGRNRGMTEEKRTVLIVDDSSPMRRALRGILERAGFTVVGEAGNGIEAIKLFRELKPDLVTLDIVMPQLDGVQTLRSIREMHPEARVVMVTAMTSLSKIQECVRFGATHYIVKPFEEKKVREVLAKVLPCGGPGAAAEVAP